MKNITEHEEELKIDKYSYNTQQKESNNAD